MSKKTLFFITCLVLLSRLNALAQTQVHYIANEGILLQSGKQKILIDALFDDYYESYAYPSIQLVEDINNKQVPYENIDLFLGTHVHRDHFYAKMVAKFMMTHPETHFISTKQASDSLALISTLYDDISARITGYSPKKGWHLFEKDGINVHAIFVRHGGQRNYGIDNLVFLVEVNGKKIIHLGDAEMKLSHFPELGLSDKDIDLALVPYWFLGYPPGQEIIKKYVNPKKVIGIHYPKVGDPKSLQLIRENFNNAVIFMNTGERVDF